MECKQCQLFDRTADQEVLHEVLWPTIRTRVLRKDRQFSFGERRNFCPFESLPAGDHLSSD
jgi:hypothetical protein